GVATYEALVGAPPFRGDNVAALAVQILHEPPPAPTKARPELPPGIDAWFARACAKAPEERFASAREMADALWVALALQPRASGPLPPGSSDELAPASVPSVAQPA